MVIKKMNKLAAVITTMVLLASWLPGLDKHFKLVRVIGEEDKNNFIFSRISGALLTPSKHIIIADELQNFIARYDWDGNFVDKIGQHGRGPGDFILPRDLDITGTQISLLDQGNRRIARMNEDLENLHYIRLPQKTGFCAHFRSVDKTAFFITSKFSMSFTAGLEKNPKIFCIDGSGLSAKIKYGFFTFTPMDTGDVNLKEIKILRRITTLSSVIYGIDRASRRLLVSFTMPDNPVVFYLYNFEGKLLKRFSRPVDKKYTFLHDLYRLKQATPGTLKGKHTPNVVSIFFCNRHWYVTIALKHYKEIRYPEKKYHFMKFNREGDLVEEYTDSRGLIVYYVSPLGYVLGKNPDGPFEQLEIFRVPSGQ